MTEKKPEFEIMTKEGKFWQEIVEKFEDTIAALEKEIKLNKAFMETAKEKCKKANK